MVVIKQQSETCSSGSGSAKKCLIPNCVRHASRRGCCVPCLQSLRRQVNAGKTTWKKLLNAGLVLESRRGLGRCGVATEAVSRICK